MYPSTDDLDSIFEHFCFNLFNTPIRPYPFPHFHATNVFPEAYYHRLLSELPIDADYLSNEGKYNGRRFASPANLSINNYLLSKHFIKRAINHFGQHFPSLGSDEKVSPELRLVRDGETYSIGPHTDAKWKLISLLFYLPKDFNHISAGTSIYTPKDPSFRCPGGPHHNFENFRKLTTLPYVPNSCLGFLKTDNSFHGVEQITYPIQRDVLLWNLYRVKNKDIKDIIK